MAFLRKIYYALPPRWRLLTRQLVYFPLDVWDRLRGHQELRPPRRLIFTGSGDFLRQGRQYLQFFKELGHLQPHHRVLDIGSGIGRMAIPLTGYLDERGSYEGFDIMEVGVRWCQRNISSRYPNFRFQQVDLANDLYRLEGASADTFRFPFPDADFDFVILTSVFTHMLPEQVGNYLQEIQRVLRPGGRVFATFFLITPENEDLQDHGGAFDFPHNRGHYRLMDAKVPSANVAYRESYIRELINEIVDEAEDVSLQIEAIHYGYWGRQDKENKLDFQDVVVMSKQNRDGFPPEIFPR